MPRRRRRPWWLLGLAAAGAAGLVAWLSLETRDALQPTSSERDALPVAPATAPATTPAVTPGVAPAAASSTPGTFRDCGECPEMVVAPAGSFLMGAPAEDLTANDEERPQHSVTIPTPFGIGRTEVTFAEWGACVAEGGCGRREPDHEGWGGGPRPVINVSWHDATAYVAWLTGRTGRPYRLPTEAEWEYAARGGTTTAYWWGDEIGRDNADCKDCGSRWDNQETAPVASFEANPFGLYDVHGNVWEWVEDCWTPNYDGASAEGVPPMVRRGCARRVLRGGSWDTSSPSLRASARAWGEADGRNNIVGFRVVTSDVSGEPAGPVSPSPGTPDTRLTK